MLAFVGLIPVQPSNAQATSAPLTPAATAFVASISPAPSATPTVKASPTPGRPSPTVAAAPTTAPQAPASPKPAVSPSTPQGGALAPTPATEANPFPDTPDEPATLVPVAPDPSQRKLPGVYHAYTKGGWTTVRSYVQQFMIGHARNGTIIDVSSKNPRGSQYYLGYFRGLGLCAWITVSNTRLSAGTYKSRCPAGNYAVEPKQFAAYINCDRCDKGTPIRLHSGARILRNVSPIGATHPTDAVATWGTSQAAGWRYVTKDGKYIAFSNSKLLGAGGSNWAFTSVKNVSVGKGKTLRQQLCPHPYKGPRGDGHGNWPTICAP